MDDQLVRNRVQELEPERQRPALAAQFLFAPQMHQIEVGRRAVRGLGRGMDAENDLFDFEFGLGGPGRRGRDLRAVPLERGVGEFRREEPEAAGPVLLDRRSASRMEVVDEPVQEYFVVGSSGSACAVAAS